MIFLCILNTYSKPFICGVIASFEFQSWPRTIAKSLSFLNHVSWGCLAYLPKAYISILPRVKTHKHTRRTIYTGYGYARFLGAKIRLSELVLYQLPFIALFKTSLVLAQRKNTTSSRDSKIPRSLLLHNFKLL